MIKLSVRHILAAISWLALSLMPFTAQAIYFFGIPTGAYTPEIYYRNGAVYTRAIIPGPTGRPVYVEYDSSGKEVREIGEAIGELERAEIQSASYYNALFARFDEVRSRYPDSRVLTAEEYRIQSFKTVSDGLINKPQLQVDSKTVIVRAANQLFDQTGKDLILLELPIKTTVRPGSNTSSLLVSEAGDFLHQSQNAIAFRVGFYGKDGKANDVRETIRQRDDQIYGPLQHVRLYTVTKSYAGGLTDEKGKYSLQFELPSCPGSIFEHYVPTFLEMRYFRFSPRGRSMGSYFLQREDYELCNGMGYWSINALGTVASSATPIRNPADFPIDLMVLNGSASIANVNVAQATEHNAETAEHNKRVQDFYDFDGDETPDYVVPGKKELKEIDGENKEVFVKTGIDEAELQGVYLTSIHDGIPEDLIKTPPDFTRLIDADSDFKDRGLLESLSEEDLRDTDVYIFRESTGQLIAERRGLHESELDKNYTGDGAFNFTLHLRGSVENRHAFGRRFESGFKKWQSAGGFREEFQRREANHLKSGEVVQIIAINRPTGYIGSIKVKLQDASRTFSLNSNQVIKMGPPNLKVWAERRNQVQYGATAGEQKRQLIGNEGAGLGSDISIAIYTDWRDADGSPLPEELSDYGYTGRLAKIVAANKLAPVGANQLSQFNIKPGQQIQVINLPEKLLAKQHLYLQVAGQPTNRNPDFSTGQGGGILEHRPSHYVPVKVPLHDEEASELSRQAYRKAGATSKKPEPLYAWQYRPELQFSLYDLNVREIRRVDYDDKNYEILKEKNPILTTSDKLLEFYYSLLKAEFNMLQSWDVKDERQIILAVGEQEIKAVLGQDKTIKFENFKHLSDLDVDDYLSMRLYANNDVGNTLWEYAFDFLYVQSLVIGSKYETDDVFYVPVDKPFVELKGVLAGYSERNNRSSISARWGVHGEGQFSTSVQASNIGVFDNTLNMPPRKGATAQVYLELLNDKNTKVVWKKVEVIAGEPARIEKNVTGEMIVFEQGQLRIDLKVYDNYGNSVEDGTPVTFTVGDSARIVSEQTETVDGKAFVVLTGGNFAEDNVNIDVSTGALNESFKFPVKGLNLKLFADKIDLEKGESATLRAIVNLKNGQPAVNVPVSFGSSQSVGFFESSYQLTDSQGIAKVKFTAGLNSTSGELRARLGYMNTASLNVVIRDKPPQSRSLSSISIDAPGAMLVGDTSEAGAVVVDTHAGAAQAPFEVKANLTVTSNEPINVVLGDMADPNLEPLLSLQMSQLEDGFKSAHLEPSPNTKMVDEVGLNPALVQEVNTVQDHPLGMGFSAELARTSAIRVPSPELLKFTDGFGLRLDLKPLGDGEVINFHGHRLSYKEGKLIYQLTTSAGQYSTELTGVTPATWHLVAFRSYQGKIELYVNGRIATAPYQGQLSDEVDDLVIGGLPARMRNLKVFDWNSQPLIAFSETNDANIDIGVGVKTLEVKSLGNIGLKVPGSKLAQHSVAILAGQERNYVSVITRQGFVQLAELMMFTISEEQVQASIPFTNPVAALVPTAYAWTWEGVWENTKTVLNVFLPLEDLRTLGQQIMYWATEDPKFEPADLIFAALGVATIFPPAKILKPVLMVVKPLFKAISKVPGLKYVAGALGTIIKETLSTRNLQRLDSLLPLFFTAIELFTTEGGTDAIKKIFESMTGEEDFWAWCDYFLEISKSVTGFTTDPFKTSAYTDSYPWMVAESKLVPIAYAFTPRRGVAQEITKLFAKSLKDIEPRGLMGGIKGLVKAIKSGEVGFLSKFMLNSTLLELIAGKKSLNGKQFQFLMNIKNWRIHWTLIVAAIVYLEEERANKRLNISDEDFYDLVADTISWRPWAQHGAVFHISQVLYYHLRSQVAGELSSTGEDLPISKIVGIEQVRPAVILGVKGDLGKPYNRRIDIVLSNEDGEFWVELKSRAGFDPKWFENGITPKNPKGDEKRITDYHRQFFHDLRLNKDFINPKNKNKILNFGHNGNRRFVWYFQGFRNIEDGKSVASPTARDLEFANKNLCQRPRELTSEISLINLRPYATRDCIKGNFVKLRDTKSYVTEILNEKFASKMGIEAFAKLARDLFNNP